jgi:hypothetical protein
LTACHRLEYLPLVTHCESEQEPMNLELRDQFLIGWQKYFPSAEFPISFYYTDTPIGATPVPSGDRPHCLIAELGAVRKGKSVSFDINSVPCMGGKRFLGFSDQLRPGFRYFLSCGIEGKIPAERYKKSPELVDRFVASQPVPPAPASNIVFKRIDSLVDTDQPVAAIFFARPDILSGLFTLANYDEEEREAVCAPFGAGCSSIVHQPMLESAKDRPRGVIGMFDITARPHIPADMLTFAVVWRKFESMVRNMDESFLITDSWSKVQRRLEKETT